MHGFIKRLSLPLIAILILSGCNIRAPQLASLQAMIETPFVDSGDNLWTLSYGDYTSEVFPVETEQGVQFLSYGQDTLLFDGFIIRSVSQIGDFYKAYSVRDKLLPDGSLQREVMVNARVVERLECPARQAQGATAFWQCKTQKGDERVFALTFGENGELIQITQPFADTGKLLTIAKN